VNTETAKSNSKEKADPKKDKTAQLSLSPEELLTLPAQSVVNRLNSSLDGLTSQEVEKRLQIYGRNELEKAHKHSAIREFLLHFKSPLVIILLIAGLISGILGEIANVVIIFVIVLISTILDFYQESKAEKAAQLLKEKVTTTATLLRDNVKQEVKLPEIVPGDIIYLSSGDITPADARLITAKDLFVNQSSLTGESFPVEKTPVPLMGKDVPVTEWTNYFFMGTSIVSGTATAVVVKTGSSTEYGKIAKKLVERPPETEFEKGIKSFGFLIMQATILLVMFVFLVIAVRNPTSEGVLNALLFAVALAVGLTPELLPMIITINLTRGAIAMSKKDVIVKRLSSIENFGSMDVLCTDKTGTLTENRIKLLLHVDVEGKDNNKVLLYSFLNSHFQTGLQSPLDEAILKFKEIDVTKFQKIDEVPFDFVRRRVSVVVEEEKQRFFVAKGAPEEILKVCSQYEVAGIVFDLTNGASKNIERKYNDLSADGLRALGVAYKRIKEEKAVYSINDESDMVFLGFVAFLDPPKETAKESLKLLSDEGIELKIVTGDNELVTRKVCAELGFEVKGVAFGNDISSMPDETLSVIAEEANIFARVTPAQKDRIIALLRKNGHVVGYMGDGINDAPSLRTSDVGISVNNAVDVARESADIILLKNDLTVLAQGVLEGRKTFGNTMKYIMMGVSSNFGNMFSAAGGALFLPFLPMLPIQILLNNLLYDTSQTALTTDNVDEEYVLKPKRWDISFIRRFMVTFGPVSSLFDFATFFTILFIFNAWTNEGLFQTAWFIESLCSQTLVVLIIRTRRVPFYKSKPSKYLAIMLLAVIIVSIIIPYTPVNAFFGLVPPPPAFFLVLVGILGAYALLVETVKSWFYKRHAYRLEQILIPKRKPFYNARTTRFMQDMIAVISLRAEEEIYIDSLTEDLKSVITYPLNPNQLVRNLQHLRRLGLIKLDWNQKILIREKTMKEYVKKNYVDSEMWMTTAENWRKINTIILKKRNKVNADYQELLLKK
jgi:P-type Mg2+ transporter